MGEKVKKNQDDIVYTFNGKYTTCDAETPHFSIRAKKIKTIPNKKIITGPAILEFSGVPTPLAIPFGFFPNQKNKVQALYSLFMVNLQIKVFFLEMVVTILQ